MKHCFVEVTNNTIKKSDVVPQWYATHRIKLVYIYKSIFQFAINLGRKTCMHGAAVYSLPQGWCQSGAQVAKWQTQNDIKHPQEMKWKLWNEIITESQNNLTTVPVPGCEHRTSWMVFCMFCVVQNYYKHNVSP